jgi:hypothetical protein
MVNGDAKASIFAKAYDVTCLRLYYGMASKTA